MTQCDQSVNWFHDLCDQYSLCDVSFLSVLKSMWNVGFFQNSCSEGFHLTNTPLKHSTLPQRYAFSAFKSPHKSHSVLEPQLCPVLTSTSSPPISYKLSPPCGLLYLFWNLRQVELKCTHCPNCRNLIYQAISDNKGYVTPYMLDNFVIYWSIVHLVIVQF